MAFGGKLNPKSLRGGFSQVDPINKIGITGWPVSPNKISNNTTGQQKASVYIGNGINTSGTTERNIAVWNGATQFAETIQSLTLNNARNSVILVPSMSSSQSMSTDNNVAIGAVTTIPNGGNAVVIGTGGGTGTGCVALGQASANGSSSIAIGSNSASASASTSLAIGANNLVAGHFTGIALGCYAVTEMVNELALGGQVFVYGSQDAKCSFLTTRAVTSNATATELGNNSSSYNTTTINSYIVLTNASAYMFDCDIVARQDTTGDTSVWNLRFAIKRGANAASTTLLGSPTATLIAQDAGASAWTVAVTADTTNGRPAISVTGEASKTIRWVSTAKITKVMN